MRNPIMYRIAKLSATVVLNPMHFGRSGRRRIDPSYQISYNYDNADATFRRRIESLRVTPCQAGPSAHARPRCHRHVRNLLVLWNPLGGEPVKINLHEFNEYLSGLSHDDPAVRQKSVSGLAKYSSAEWQGTPDAIRDAVAALLSASRLRTAAAPDGVFRAEAAKVLGNIGTQSPAVLPELVRLLQKDADARVRTEGARALGKIGEGAASASRTIAAVLDDRDSGETVRAAAAWALARVDPLSAGTASSLRAATDDRNGHVGVCAAEALWKVSPETSRAILALAARLGDPGVQQAAAQALYRIGPAAKEAVPALLASADAQARLFPESLLFPLPTIPLT